MYLKIIVRNSNKQIIAMLTSHSNQYVFYQNYLIPATATYFPSIPLKKLPFFPLLALEA